MAAEIKQMEEFNKEITYENEEQKLKSRADALRKMREYLLNGRE